MFQRFAVKSFVLLILTVCFQCAKASIITLATNAPANGHTNSIQMTITSNQTAQLLYSVSRYPAVQLSGGTIFTATSGMIVAGPATFTLTAFTGSQAGGADNAICTFNIDSAIQFTPSTTVVVPADSGGPVNILLESSTDLINWNSALPGTYATSTTNRFFRVRAVRQ